ncbi:MAG: autotransporter-associated beta strand repeat-containing protein, partial [Planctomycetota bacterium]|nr:autotransporter-associated beta strand repeat-containing protein [Planctomycetota bacterium]
GNFTGTGGMVINNNNSNKTLTIGNGNGTGGNYAGVIADNTTGTGTVALTKVGAGTITLSGANTYSGGTKVLEGALLVSNTTGSATGTGTVTVGAATLGGRGFINGPVTLTGGSTLTSTGTLTINNTLTVQGPANQLSSGTVLTTGDVTIDPGAVFSINGTLGGDTGLLIVRGTLQGTGRVGAIMGISGHLHPGGSPGILASGNLAMSPAFCFDVSLDGSAAGTGYSQLDVTGTVDLGGATLGATLGYAPPWYSGGSPPDLLYIIKNDGTDPVIGQFAGLPQMSEFDLLFNGTPYKATISYQGNYDAGTPIGGNDVVVALPEPATLSLLALGGLALLRRSRRK